MSTPKTAEETATAQYDEWLEAQIEESINDPRSSVPNDEARRQFAAKRAALRKLIETGS